MKKCIECKNYYEKKASRQKVCDECRDEYIKKRDKEYQRKRRKTKAFKIYQKQYYATHRFRKNYRDEKPKYHEIDQKLIELYVYDEYGYIIGYRLKSSYSKPSELMDQNILSESLNQSPTI